MTEFFQCSNTEELIVCTYQDTNRKSTNACEWFYARSDHTLAHNISLVSVDRRQFFYCVARMNSSDLNGLLLRIAS